MKSASVLRWTRSGAAILLVLAVIAASGTPVAAAASTSSAPPSSPALAGDGKIAYVKNGDIYTINPDGTGKTALVTVGTNFGPAWSADGTQIAYVQADETNATDLWVMNADGTDQTRLTTTGAVLAAAPSWSPDGSEIVYGGPCLPTASNPGLCRGEFYHYDDPVVTVIDPTSVAGKGRILRSEWHCPGTETGIIFIDGRASWSPSGDSVVFYAKGNCAGDDQFITRYTFADQSIDDIDYTGGGGRWGTYGNPVYSPDGRLVAYDREYGDVEGETHVGIAMRLLGEGFVDFKESENDRQLAFAPSQTRVALVRVPNNRIVLASMHGRHRTFLTRGSEPSWQPVV